MEKIKFIALNNYGQWVYGIQNLDSEIISSTHILSLSKFFSELESGRFKKDSLNKYIGIKDIYGDEIYTNNIIQFHDGKDYLIGIVKWDENRLGYKVVVNGIIDFYFENLLSMNYGIEIIGTFEENPELLVPKT